LRYWKIGQPACGRFYLWRCKGYPTSFLTVRFWKLKVSFVWIAA